MARYPAVIDARRCYCHSAQFFRHRPGPAPRFAVRGSRARGGGRGRTALHRRGPHTVRIHCARRRSGPAVHAFADRAGGRGRPCHRDRPPSRRLSDRNRAERRLRAAARARPCRRLRSGAAAARGNQDRARRCGRGAGPSSASALGAGQGLRLADVPARGVGRYRDRGGVFRYRQRRRARRGAALYRGGAARLLRGAMPRLYRLGRAGAGASRRARSVAGLACLSACRIPGRPARTRRIGLSREPLRPLPARAGAHRHRQDGRHDLPRAEGDAEAEDRQAVRIVGPLDRPGTGAGSRARAGRAAGSDAPARAGDGGPRQGLRISGAGLSRRSLSAGARFP
ncbi:hypothetical protein OJJOAM_004432 [Cupriavidus sp. H18C1]